MQGFSSKIIKCLATFILVLVAGLSIWGVSERLIVEIKDIPFEPTAQPSVPLKLFWVAPKSEFLFTLLDNNQLEVLVKANENNGGPISAIVSMDMQKPPLAVSSDANTSCRIEGLAPGATAYCYFRFAPKVTDSITYSLRVLLNGGKAYDTVEKEIKVFPVPAESILKYLASALTALLALLGGNAIKELALHASEKLLRWIGLSRLPSPSKDSEG